MIKGEMMDRKEMQVYRKSLELVIEILKLGAEREDARCGSWEKSTEETCVAVSFHIAKGSALYPAPACLEHWRAAESILEEVYLLLDLAFEEKRIDVSRRRELAAKIVGLSRMISGLLAGSREVPHEA